MSYPIFHWNWAVMSGNIEPMVKEGVTFIVIQGFLFKDKGIEVQSTIYLSYN